MSAAAPTPPGSAPEPGWFGPALGVGAYLCWGLLPLYIKLLEVLPPLELMSHRVIWSLLLLAGIATVARRWGAIRLAATGRTLAMLGISAVLIGMNWLIYIFAVENSHVLEASLGYFINPLVNVALGVAVLGERLRRAQAIAVGIAAIGVVAFAAAGGGALWISLTLAVSFACYGLVRKLAPIDALGGLLVETALLAPPSLIVLGIAGARSGGIGTRGIGFDALVVGVGIVTAAPLLMFAGAAKRLRFATLGLLQFIAPTLQFAQAVLLFGEPVRPVHAVTFGCIWAGLVLYATDGWRAARMPIAPTLD